MAKPRVYVVDGARTPFLKAQNAPGPFSAADLAVAAGRTLFARSSLTPDMIDEAIVGCVIPAPDEANIARIIALRLGCGKKVPAFTVQRNCASGLQAVASAYDRIMLGASDIVLAGGTEAMSRSPIQWNSAMVGWLSQLMRAKSLPARVRAIARLRPAYLKPVFTLLLGLSDPLVKLSMGQTAEVVAKRFAITREQQDAFAFSSHKRLAAAFDDGAMDDEVIHLFDHRGNAYFEDTGMRRDTDMDKLAKLRPVFDRKYGLVTSGNSSQVTDGAAMLLLANDKAVQQHDLPVLGEVVDHQWAGVDPAQMGLGPVHAVAGLLARQRLDMNQVDQVELNEAFSAQVLGCQAAWDSVDYCREELGLGGAIGAVDTAKLNPEGGAISCGHPIGASGARLVLHALLALKRRGGGQALATLCIGGGQGGAMLLRSGTPTTTQEETE